MCSELYMVGIRSTVTKASLLYRSDDTRASGREAGLEAGTPLGSVVLNPIWHSLSVMRASGSYTFNSRASLRGRAVRSIFAVIQSIIDIAFQCRRGRPCVGLEASGVRRQRWQLEHPASHQDYPLPVEHFSLTSSDHQPHPPASYSFEK